MTLPSSSSSKLRWAQVGKWVSERVGEAPDAQILTLPLSHSPALELDDEDEDEDERTARYGLPDASNILRAFSIFFSSVARSGGKRSCNRW